MKQLLLISLLVSVSWLQPSFAADTPPPKAPPVKIIFDTDIGNDVDDVLALSILHALQTRRDCDLLGVTVTLPEESAGPFVDSLNTFYGRPDLPIGCVRPVASTKPSKFLRLAEVKDGGGYRYHHDLAKGSDAPAPVPLLRKLLSQEPDGSVVLVQVGYFSNLAKLLGAPPEGDPPLSGRELVTRKVRLLSVMAGAFRAIGNNQRFLEFNVVQDLPAARQVAKDWPTPIVWSGFEIGIAVPYPASSIDRDFGYVPHHPAAEAYYLYEPPPHNRPSWDLTSVLYAVFPSRDFFDLSARGLVTVEEDGFTRFDPNPGGRDRYLILKEGQIPRVIEAMVQLASQPPCQVAK